MSRPTYDELLDIAVKQAVIICERNAQIAALNEENEGLIDRLAEYEFMYDLRTDMANIESSREYEDYDMTDNEFMEINHHA